MPDIGKMFPKKELHYTDFVDGEIHQATIRMVVLAAARMNFARASPGQANQPEQEWQMFFEEFQKPMRLRPAVAKTIAMVLGTTVTEEWIGRKIQFYRGKYESWGEWKDGLLIDTRPPVPTGPALAAGKDKGAHLLKESSRGRVLPREAVERWQEKAKAQGKRWQDFLTYLKAECPEGFSLVVGADLDGISAALIPAMEAFLAPPAPPLTAKPDAPLATRVATNKHGHPEQIEEDDIPFDCAPRCGCGSGRRGPDEAVFQVQTAPPDRGLLRSPHDGRWPPGQVQRMRQGRCSTAVRRHENPAGCLRPEEAKDSCQARGQSSLHEGASTAPSREKPRQEHRRLQPSGRKHPEASL